MCSRVEPHAARRDAVRNAYFNWSLTSARMRPPTSVVIAAPLLSSTVTRVRLACVRTAMRYCTACLLRSSLDVKMRENSPGLSFASALGST